jgi:hypothetical protein
MTAWRGWGFAEQHLALDALVAFVDGELSPSAYDRAASHLASCPACAADAAAQRQARTAVRSAAAPSMSPKLLQALQAIPCDAELPEQPDGLALTDDGQLVTVNRRDRATAVLGSGAVLGSSAPLGGGQSPLGSSAPLGGGAEVADHPAPTKESSRRTKQGAGVVFSGLVLGALALINVPADEQREPNPNAPHPFSDGSASYGNAATPASARVAAPGAPADAAASTSPAPSRVAAQTGVLSSAPASSPLAPVPPQG